MIENKILVVDDEVAILDLLKETFSDEGYKVFVANNAEEGYEIFKKENVLVIFLDLKMPGKNGFELCKEMKSHMPACICHAVTGYSSAYELNDCREAGFDDYFTKPVELDTLITAAKNAFIKLNRWKRK